ncbi:MAG TPA: glycosyltransferase family 39 protein [Solirubrobacteraceae bacterium]|jgi:4-amino-4-deoxy-L-arabinose transferase-like glycosyltransferase
MSLGLEAAPSGGGPAALQRSNVLRARAAIHCAGLAAVLALSAVLEFVKLEQNGYANTFYSAAVKSMLRSWHNFFFVASDPNGFITVDKPPLALWLQALSAKLFGFSALSLIVPEGICAVLAVALLYRLMAPRFGHLAALASAFALAVFPSFVAVSRDNAVDPLLILLMLAACGAALAAIDGGRLRWLAASAVLVGLAFNTKSLAALLCVPGIGAGYLLCAPGSPRRRIAQLALAGIVAAAVALSWSLAVDLTPSSQRPYVGGSVTNSEFQLEFGYNGFGRVGGQAGGPGSSTRAHYNTTQLRPLIPPAPTPAQRRYAATQAREHPAPPPLRTPASRVGRRPIQPFGGARSPVRIFSQSLGDQAGWLVPLALFGIFAIALAISGRRDRRSGALVVLGGWFVVELATLDFSAGIVHPYYASALGPGVAAMVGGGGAALASILRRPESPRALPAYVLAVLAVVSTAALQWVLIDREHGPLWWRIPLVALCLLGLIAIPALRERPSWALAPTIVALMIAPMIYSFSVWDAPVDGTFPTAGRYNHAGYGGIDVNPDDLFAYQGLIRYLHSHAPSARYPLLTQSSDQAAPLTLLGLRASADGGYGAADPALSNQRLADLVAAGQARYLLIDGSYSDRGSNLGVDAARLVCPEIPEVIWAPGSRSDLAYSFLVDCAGRASQLRHPYASALAYLRAHPSVHHPLSSSAAQGWVG